MASRLLIALVCGIVAMLGFLLYCSKTVPQLEGRYISRQTVQDTGEPLYAIADLHGDYSKALEALQLAGLVGKEGYWSGKQASLVQLGDVMDRGPYSLDCVNLFQRLKDEAGRVGGSVDTLLGNHEMMNLEGMHQYVSGRELQRLLKDLEPEALDAGQQKDQALALWKRHLQPDQKVGKALRQMPVALLKGLGKCRTLFVHAGMLPGMLTQLELHRSDIGSPVDLIQDLNDNMKGVLKCLGGSCKAPESSLRQLHDPDGVLWYRGYAEKAESVVCPGVHAVLRRVQALQIVVGHNVVRGGKPRILCGKALYMMDVGMSGAYLGSNAAVWSCHHGQVKILT